MPKMFADHEVENGWNYAKTDRPAANFVGVVTDRNLLRAIANDARSRWNRGDALAPLVGVVCREYLRQRDITEEQTYEAYLCGTMKMFSDRRARSNKAQTKKRKVSTPVRRQKETFAELPNGQFLLPMPQPRGSTTRVQRASRMARR